MEKRHRRVLSKPVVQTHVLVSWAWYYFGYGTAYDILLVDQKRNGEVFKLHKDGSNYTILQSFDGSIDSWPNGAIKAHDGILYGTSFFSDCGGGEVFEIWPPETPDLLALSIMTNSVLMSFAGTGGYQYEVLRSTDLANWTELNTITMPLIGMYTNGDNTPPEPGGYIRWILSQHALSNMHKLGSSA
jgi:hypothetical protein